MIVDKQLLKAAKEKLGLRNAELIAQKLNLEALNYDAKNGKSLCPFHEEKTPSFVFNPKENNFHCFGCGKTVDLLDVMMMSDKCSFMEAVQKLFDLADIPFSFGTYKVKTRPQYKYPHEEPKTDCAKAADYLALRKISRDTMNIADIREDEHGNIVFNYYDLNDVLTMVKYRPSRKVNKGENKCWCQKGADTAHLLFNMKNINTDRPLLICEGEIDCLSAIEAGYTNAVSVPLGAGNTHWIEENWEWLEQFDSIIICADNDECGTKLQKDATYRLGSWRTKFVEIPQIVQLESGKRVRTKDLNEILYYLGKERVFEMITNAKDTPVDSVVDLADVKDVDLSSIDGIYTGITSLDKELMRLFYGSLTIVTGTPGSGKTSFLYQLICQALEQDKNCWLFSKELPAYMTKNWFTYIAAGARHISDYETPNHTIYYKVNDSVKKEIDEAYRSQLFIYKDDYDNSFEVIKKSMEDTARKYGAKLFILDNLMTINLNADNDNKYEKQTELINWLISFSMKYNVAVLLVCHPRKLVDVKVIDKYDISGSSNLINLAHRTLSLRRITDKEKAGIPNKNGGWTVPPIRYDVIVSVLKDRLRGREGFEVGLYYDRKTRRFYTNLQEYAYQYKWDKHTYSQPIRLPERDDTAEVLGKVD